MQNAGLLIVAVAVAVSACGGGDGGTPPTTAVFTSLTVSPADPDMVDGDTLQLTATPRDQNGAPMSVSANPTFSLTSGTSVSVTPAGRVVALDPGNSTVTASLTSGGTMKEGTSTPSVTALPTFAGVTASGAGTSFGPGSVKIAVGGRVTWSFPGPETHNVTFDGTPPTGGDIAARNSGSEFRDFATVGRHSYRCTLHAGMTGEVIVRTP